MLGEKLKKIREANHINQVQTGELLGVSKQSVSNWENNNVIPSIQMIIKFCRLFSCSADYLFGLESDAHIKLDGSNLTDEQLAHINQLINDYTYLNYQIKLLNAALEHTEKEES